MTRKIIDVPWNVTTSLYEFWVRMCSSGVASCARMSSAMIPPPAKKTSAVAMYMIPIRLWSTVTSQRATRPFRQLTGYTASDLTATGARPLVDVRLRVADERVHLLLRPGVADRRHLAPPVANDRLEAAPLRDEGVVGERRAVAALALHAVARRADTLVLGLAEPDRRAGADERLVVGRRLDDDGRLHLRVERPAELGALALVASPPLRLEPRVVDAARDRLDLALQLRDPPAVHDVRRDHPQLDLRAQRHVQV